MEKRYPCKKKALKKSEKLFINNRNSFVPPEQYMLDFFTKKKRKIVIPSMPTPEKPINLEIKQIKKIKHPIIFDLDTTVSSFRQLKMHSRACQSHETVS